MTPSKLIKAALKFPLQLAASRFGAHRRESAEPRLWILMYHRVLPATDPRFAAEEPGMVVTPETLRLHLSHLRRHFELVSLPDWESRRRQGLPLPAKACAITFDDGWSDNYEFAAPILEEFNAPATIFAVTDLIGTRNRFWPNRLAGLLSSLPPDWQVNDSLLWLSDLAPELKTASLLCPDQIAAIIDRAKSYSDAQMLDWLDQTDQALTSTTETRPDLMSWDQLRELRQGGLIEIGSHTCSHARLNHSLEDATAQREILASKEKLELELDAEVSLFCYPNGDTSDAATRYVSRAYSAAVTTRRGINSVATDPFKLNRISIHNGNSNSLVKFESQLACWPIF